MISALGLQSARLIFHYCMTQLITPLQQNISKHFSNLRKSHRIFYASELN